MDDQPPSFDNLFASLSRLTIIIPIVVIILALFITYTQQPSIVSQARREIPTPFPSPLNLTPQPTIKPLSTTYQFNSKSSIDLTGPSVCLYSTESATVSAYIKNKSAFAEITKKNERDNVLYKEDCLYVWKKNEYKGSKMCGLSPWVDIISMVSRFIPLNQTDIRKMLSSSQLSGLSNGILATTSAELPFDTFAQSCKKQDFDPMKLEIPKNIFFQSTELGSTPSPTVPFKQP